MTPHQLTWKGVELLEAVVKYSVLVLLLAPPSQGTAGCR